MAVDRAGTPWGAEGTRVVAGARRWSKGNMASATEPSDEEEEQIEEEDPEPISYPLQVEYCGGKSRKF